MTSKSKSMGLRAERISIEGISGEVREGIRSETEEVAGVVVVEAEVLPAAA